MKRPKRPPRPKRRRRRNPIARILDGSIAPTPPPPIDWGLVFMKGVATFLGGAFTELMRQPGADALITRAKLEAKKPPSKMGNVIAFPGPKRPPSGDPPDSA